VTGGNPKRLGQALRGAREAIGISQAALAQRLGWHQTMVAKTEDGSRKLGLLEAIQYAKALGLKLDDVLYLY
jgi:transcriptional regulator with XRE-family HTH domain